MTKPHDTNSFAVDYSYLRGRVEAQAEIAKSLGILQIELAERMGNIFSDTSPLRTLLGISHSLPDMRLPAPARNQGKRSALALPSGSHPEASRNGDADFGPRLNKNGDRRGMNQGKRAKPSPPASQVNAHRNSIAMKEYWSRMTPEERKAENARRDALRQKNKRAKEKAQKAAQLQQAS